jgi:hypothetical protein
VLVLRLIFVFNLIRQRKEDFDYLYGLSVVLPALEQKRRKFHRLFVQEGILFRKKERYKYISFIKPF